MVLELLKKYEITYINSLCDSTPFSKLKQKQINWVRIFHSVDVL